LEHGDNRHIRVLWENSERSGLGKLLAANLCMVMVDQELCIMSSTIGLKLVCWQKMIILNIRMIRYNANLK